MKEAFIQGENPQLTELSVDPRVFEVLKGKVQKVKTVSHKPGETFGKQTDVFIAKEGPAMFGLTDWQDNKEWSGIMNHMILSARFSIYFAEQLAQKGLDVNPQRILNTMLVSHTGRRVWDEAGWYPEAVSNPEEIRSKSNETLGMELIQGKVPQDAFDLVVALGHNVEGFSVDPVIFESLDYKITEYVDHRTTSKYEPLHTRMGDFLLGNFFKGQKIELEFRKYVYETIKDIIDKRKDFQLKKEETKEITLDEADEMIAQLGVSEDSERITRKNLVKLILQDADTEAFLIENNIDPEVDMSAVKMQDWEDDFRRKYIESAKESIVDAVENGNLVLNDPKTWWDVYIFRLYTEQMRNEATQETTS